MLVSINWIKDYVELDRWPSNREFCERMIMSGSNIETTQLLGEGISGVRIGRITKTEKHPDADRLTVCQADMGNETVQIVTSASPLAGPSHRGSPPLKDPIKPFFLYKEFGMYAFFQNDITDRKSHV